MACAGGLLEHRRMVEGFRRVSGLHFNVSDHFDLLQPAPAGTRSTALRAAGAGIRCSPIRRCRRQCMKFIVKRGLWLMSRLR